MIFFKKKQIDLNAFFPSDFVDMHSHILPGIDDGAKDIETSINLIQGLNKYGISNFRVTPHVLGGVWENSSTTIKETELYLKEELNKRGLEHIQIHAAAEYLMDPFFSDLLEKDDILPLKGKYLLVEMSFLNPPINLKEILFQIQLKGYTPVLAHPERYLFYHNNFAIYKELIDAGCLLQLNLFSLAGHYGKEVMKTAHKLLKNNLYTYVGTDIHKERHLPVIEKLATAKNQELLQPLFKNNIDTFSF
ncbi:tyrosine-protein phosphatase [Wenyingzhuangia sp. IMCC45574]